MTEVFADTSYWFARIVRTDELHAAARQAQKQLRPGIRIITTDEVLTELLNSLSKLEMRHIAIRAVQAILTDPAVTVVPQTHEGFQNGMDYYAARPDKEYSLTDCISMNTMQARGIQSVLTGDDHFRQAGFVVLLQR